MLGQRLLNKIFGPKQTEFYDDFLKQSKDVVGVVPKITEILEKGVNLELYVGGSGEGKNTWATAVIAVHTKNWVFRTKYDGGRIHNDLDQMVKECLNNIRSNWDIEYWRRMAKQEVAKDRRWIDKYL